MRWARRPTTATRPSRTARALPIRSRAAVSCKRQACRRLVILHRYELVTCTNYLSYGWMDSSHEGHEPRPLYKHTLPGREMLGTLGGYNITNHDASRLISPALRSTRRGRTLPRMDVRSRVYHGSLFGADDHHFTRPTAMLMQAKRWDLVLLGRFPLSSIEDGWPINSASRALSTWPTRYGRANRPDRHTR